MNIGLLGAHRTGKSTLAEAFAKANPQFAVCETRLSEAVREMGITVQQGASFTLRLTVQEHLLDTLEKRYSAMGTQPFVADRTPLDVLAYTWSEIQRDTLDDPGVLMAFAAHRERALAACKRFALMLHVQPGIPLVQDANKAQANRFYVEHVDAAMRLAVMEFVRSEHGEHSKVTVLPRDMIDLALRVKHLGASAAHILNSEAHDALHSIH